MRGLPQNFRRNPCPTLDEAVDAKSRVAAVDLADGARADTLSQARELVDLREHRFLVHSALTEARDRLKAAELAATKEIRDGQRDRVCELTNEIVDAGTRLAAGLKRAHKHYAAIVELGKELRVAAEGASDWPADWKWHSHPVEPAFQVLWHTLAAKYELPGRPPPSDWPGAGRAAIDMQPEKVFASLIYQRDHWLHGEEEPDMGLWREATPEEMLAAA
jgi:hypothetical protein